MQRWVYYKMFQGELSARMALIEKVDDGRAMMQVRCCRVGVW